MPTFVAWGANQIPCEMVGQLGDRHSLANQARADDLSLSLEMPNDGNSALVAGKRSVLCGLVAELMKSHGKS